MTLSRFGTLLWLVLLPTATLAADRPINIAVCDFRGYYAAQRRPITDLVIAELATDLRVAVLDRGQLYRVLDEQALDLSQDFDSATAARVGRLTGADVIVTAHMARMGEEGVYTVAVHLTGTANGRVFVVQADGHHGGGHNFNLPAVAAELAHKIVEAIEAHSSELIGTIPLTRDELIEQIVRQAQGGARPSVELQFAKEPSARAEGTATAETEFGLILQKAGFTVVDAQSAQKPDIEVTGDVTAEIGDKRGSVFPARATVNAKVRDRATGKILLLDRQSSESAGLGQRTAVDSAIESAVDALAARIVPVLSISHSSAHE